MKTKRINSWQNFLYPLRSRSCRESSSHHPQFTLLTILSVHSAPWPFLTTELCPINFLCTLLRQKGPSKIVPGLAFCVSFFYTWYNFKNTVQLFCVLHNFSEWNLCKNVIQTGVPLVGPKFWVRLFSILLLLSTPIWNVLHFRSNVLRAVFYSSCNLHLGTVPGK